MISKENKWRKGRPKKVFYHLSTTETANSPRASQGVAKNVDWEQTKSPCTKATAKKLITLGGTGAGVSGGGTTLKC